MAVRNVIFRNMDTSEELAMPVAPSGYVMETGRRVETLDMAAAGQVNLPGLETLFNENQEFLLPSRFVSYVTNGWRAPWDIVGRLEKWSADANVVRYIVTGTAVNVPVLIEKVRPREQDGTNDVYLTLTLKQYRYLTAGRVEAQQLPADNDTRPDEGEAMPGGTTYTVVAGDCLWTICQKFYGDGSLCYRLATVNGIPNSYLIHPGDVLQIPERPVLDATEQTLPPVSAGLSKEAAQLKTLIDKGLSWLQETLNPAPVTPFKHGYH